MISNFIRFYTITFNTLISIKKIANKEKFSYETLLFIFLSIPISLFILLIHSFIPEIDYIFLLLISSFIIKTVYKDDISISFFASTFSTALNLCCFLVSIIFNFPFIAIGVIMSGYTYPYFVEFINGVTIFIAHTLLMHLIFKNKHFKKGIPFLNISEKNYIGFFVCLCAIIIYSLFGNEAKSHGTMSILLIALLLIFVFILFWWKDQNNRKFAYMIMNRQQSAYEHQLINTKKELAKLQQLNDHLGSIVHKDNKIVVGMVSSIEQLLATYPNDAVAKESLEKLYILSSERIGLLNTDNSISSKCQTGSIRIDSIVNFMCQKAAENNVNLKLITDVDLSIINASKESDICTLIADAVENAIIATNYSDKKEVLLQLAINPDIVCITIFDSGIPFTPKVLQFMGRFRCTTHKDTGGTGIGMMTTFEILQRYKASYAIDETIDREPYSKSITITFDEMHNITHNGKKIR